MFPFQYFTLGGMFPFQYFTLGGMFPFQYFTAYDVLSELEQRLKVWKYWMSKKSCPISIVYSIYENGQNFLDILYK